MSNLNPQKAKELVERLSKELSEFEIEKQRLDLDYGSACNALKQGVTVQRLHHPFVHGHNICNCIHNALHVASMRLAQSTGTEAGGQRVS